METAQIPPGTMLDDKYRVDGLLAIGGMGAVYVGTHTLLEKRVAIKVLRTELVGHAEAVERFQREAVAASHIGHDNIVEVTDLGKTPGGVAFLVMEYLEGESLADLIKEHSPLPVARACEIAVEILSAIDAAHTAGIVHRDLKPANVFLARKSRGEMVKLLDFGISRMRRSDGEDHRLTRTGFVLGTPAYMSPEQACGASDVGERSDIYSTAVILYEMLCGRLPFDGENYNQLIFNILLGDSVPASDLRREVPEELSRALRMAMALSPNERFARAADFARVILPFAEVPAPSFLRAEGTAPRVSAAVVRQEPGGSRASATAITVAQTGLQNAAPTVAQAMPSFVDEAPPRRRRGAMLAVLGVGALLVGGGAIWFAMPEQRGEPVAQGSGTDGETDTRRAPEPSARPESNANAKPESKTEVKPETQSVADATPNPPTVTDPDAPAHIELSFAIEPPDAIILLDGQPIDANPLRRAPDGKPHELEVRKDGFVAQRMALRFDMNQRLQVQLSPEARPTKSPRNRPTKPGTRGDKNGKSRLIHDSPYE